MPSDFVHLHVHTEYSLLDGQSRIKSLVERANELEMPAVGISDHGVMFGVIDFYRACKKGGIHPVIGMEAYLAPRNRTDRDSVLDKRPYHLLLWAKNQQGYLNLMKLASIAQLEGYYYRPRVDWEVLSQYSEGLIATSGCLAAEIPRLVEEGLDEKAHEKIGQYLDVFGEENFYLELQPHKIDKLEELNIWLHDYRKSHHTNVQFVASNDVHYVRRADWDVHDTLLCIQTNAHKSDQNRMRMSPNDSYYMKTAEEMRAEFLRYQMPEEMIDEAFANSLKIAEMTDVKLDDRNYHLPVFPVPEDFEDVDAYLRYLCELGLGWRYPGREADQILINRMNYELEVIGRMGFQTYFLIVWDLCEFAREVDIWWNVRGSGAGSLVAYCLGITNIDPIQNSLLFERFLNPGRVSMPDIDLDYPDDRRGEMIAYVADKYGTDKVAAIITFGTMGAKASVKDVGRALDVDLAKINHATSLIPQEARQKKLDEYIEMNPELKDLYDADQEIQRVFDTAMQLQGLTRHASTHAAGVIIADKSLDQYTPLHRITGTDPSNGSLKAVTQFPMETAESIGLLKVDFLGLSTLTILRKACDLINRHHGTRYTMDNVPYRHDHLVYPLSDEEMERLDAAFEMMGRGETVGVFQVESSGMQSMLRGMRPKRFQNIVAGISLYRPGPMEFIPLYNRRMHGEEEIIYLHPKLEPILAETYGIITYQEQILQIASELFGYQKGEADLMRKAVSKKKEKDLLEHQEIFLERGPSYDVDRETADKIFEEIKFFANYGFNKAHASDYAVLTVQTAFLKCHYPAEFMTALLSVQFDNSDKVATFLEECRRLQIPVLPPHINHSAIDFDIEETEDNRGIRFGLGAIKNAGIGALQHIIDERQSNGAFSSLVEFCRRVDLRQVGKRALESLIKVGALYGWGERDDLLASLDRIHGFSADYHKAQDVGQMSLFGEATGLEEEALIIPQLPVNQRVAPREQLAWEKELLGLYVTGRPVDRHKEKFRAMSNLNIISELKDPMSAPASEKVKVAGEIVSIRKITTRNNDQMAVLQFEDWHETAATIEVVLFPRTWQSVKLSVQEEKDRELEEGDIVLVIGDYDTSRNSDEPQIICKQITFDFEYMSPDEVEQPQQERTIAWANGSSPDQSYEVPPPFTGFDEYADTLVTDTTYAADAHAHSPPEFEGTSSSQEEVRQSLPAWANGNHEEADLDENPFAGLLDESASEKQRHIDVHFQRSENPNKDRLRLRSIHRTMIGYPGNDTFSIVIEGEDQQNLILDFSDTTGWCDALQRNLESIVGEGHIHIQATS